MQRYVPPANESEKILQRRVTDIVKTVCHSGVSRYIGFFNQREKELATASFNKQKFDDYLFSGGCEGAEREMLCVFADKEDVDFPIAVLEIEPNSDASELTHRDYLGAMLATGISRECVGDIVTTDAKALVFLQQNKVAFLQQELTSVGRKQVTIKVAEKPPQEVQIQQQEIRTLSVASLRLDAVLAALLHLPRTKAAAMITSGLVQVNHMQMESVHHQVREGDVFSVRGTGKMRLCQIGGKSKKNRTRMEYILY